MLDGLQQFFVRLSLSLDGHRRCHFNAHLFVWVRACIKLKRQKKHTRTHSTDREREKAKRARERERDVHAHDDNQLAFYSDIVCYIELNDVTFSCVRASERAGEHFSMLWYAIGNKIIHNIFHRSLMDLVRAFYFIRNVSSNFGTVFFFSTAVSF